MKKTIVIILGISTLLGTVILVALAKNEQHKSSAKAGNTQNIIDENTKKIEPLPKLENPRIVIKKQERILQLFDSENFVKTYKIALGFSPTGDKEKQGDGKTPEGEFYIFTKNNQSKFYLSLGLSYPNIEDAERGLQSKLITRKQHDAIVKAIREKRTPLQNTRLGGEIYIHGGGVSGDWTWGCIALENEGIKELFNILPVGATVKIEP